MVADWVTKKYLPFCFFEDEYTQKLFHYLKPELKLPLRNELKSQIQKRYDNAQQALMEILINNSSKIAYTLDGWTSIAHKSYYGITGHFIDDDWSLQSFVVDFIPSNGCHTGRDIAEKFSNTLKKYGIEDKLQSITLDNASVNTKLVEELSHMMINFNSEDQHYKCYAHVLNLGVQAMLKVLKIDDIPEDIEDDDNQVLLTPLKIVYK